MLSDAAVQLLAMRYQRIIIDLAARNSTTVGNLWDRVGGIDQISLETFAARAAEIVGVTQQQAATLAAAYIDTMVGIDGARPTRVVDIARAVAGARNGTPLIDVYARPSITARAQIADGKDLAHALRVARSRAVSAADTDVKLAARSAARDAMTSAHVKFYKRVPDARACTFCLTASTQRYSTGELMPLHSRCGCSVMPLIGKAAESHVVDHTLLARLKASSDRPDYWNDPKAAIAVHEHGELGPVLTHAGDDFTSHADL
jgi:hypothetical protein